METSKVFETITVFLVTYIPKALLALAVLWAGWKVIGFFTNKLNKTFEKRGVEVSLSNFLSPLIGWLLKIALVISVAGMFGIQTTSFIAILGAMGLAIGLALQGSLGNFAGGVLILLFKPFKVGDYIEAQGHGGTVKEIKIFYTVLLAPDNRTIILPNGALSSGNVVNYSAEEKRRVEWDFGASYDADISKVQSAILEVLMGDDRVIKEPAPFVRVAELADSSINYKVRAWTNKDDFWSLYFDTIERVKFKFDEMAITIPFPQQDIHVYTDGKQLEKAIHENTLSPDGPVKAIRDMQG